MERNILFFGAGGGLGREMIKDFSEKDYNSITLFARDITRLPSDDKITAIKVDDLSLEENVAKAFAHIIPDRTAYYFLISTIGGFAGGTPVKDTSYKDWIEMQKINLNISFLLAKHFSRLVEVTAGGSICFIGALSAKYPEINKSAYGVSKNALNYLVGVLALEGKSYNLSANIIAPYIIDNPENRNWNEEINLMVSPKKIANLTNEIFNNFEILSGNVFELPFSLK